MTFYRILGAIGRSMITSGVILLLFVAYQLWGTGIHTRAAQNELEDEFGRAMEALAAAETTVQPAGQPTVPGGEPAGGTAPEGSPPTGPPTSAEQLDGTTEETGAGARGDPPTATEVRNGWGDGLGLGETFGLTAQQVEAAPAPEPGAGAGRINIPAIGSDWWYVEGVDLSWLRDGPGHFPGTSWPGQEGNAALAGHRTTYGAPFHRIDELEPGDEILVESLQGEFRYEVLSQSELARSMPFEATDPGSGHFIISPNDSWILEDYGDNRITLMACHPKYSASLRIVVVGELRGEVAPTTPPSPAAEEELPTKLVATEGEELLGNDPTARLPAVLWGAASGSIWFLAWQVGRTWRKMRWPAYLLGSPLFGVSLFVCFTYVERLLPAAY